MPWWHLDIWLSSNFLQISEVKSWLSQERKELSMWTSLISQMLSLRLEKQTSKNVADTTFKERLCWTSLNVFL